MNKKNTLFFAVVFFLASASSFSQITLISENFNTYNGSVGSIPAGWTIPDNSTNANSGTYYTSTASSGQSGPNSYKFRTDGVYIIPPTFTNADSVHFWVKGNSTSPTNVFYLFESADSITWDTIVAISPLPTTNYPANAVNSYPVKSTSVWLKFYYTKLIGNVAFDDFLLTGPETIKADFSAPDLCLGDSTCFSDSSLTLNGTITSWEWDFDDGSTSILQNPCHLFTAAGTYNVQLIITNSNSEKDTMVKTISVGAIPVASFTPADTSGCDPLVLSFSNNSYISSGTLTSVLWDFGNGDTSTFQNPVDTFTTGIFPVSLIVTSDLGCADTATGTTTVFSLPQIDTSVVVVTNPSCGTSNGSVTGISATGNSPLSFLWSDNSSTLDLINVPDGNYSLEVSDANNCSSSVNFTLVSPGAPPAPSVSATNINYCPGDTIDTLIATGTGGAITWFSDSALTGIIQTGDSLLPTPVPGTNTYYVTETGISCLSSATVVVINLNPDPVANAGPDSTICDGDCVQLSASGGSTYQWSPSTFLDNSALANPTSCSPATTTFSVIATNSFGCSSADSVIITINSKDTLIFENFNSYDGSTASIPAGWFISDNSTSGFNGTFYTTTSSSGPSGPNSYKFRNNGAYMITPSFSKADSVRFWIRGNGTALTEIFYVLESTDTLAWDTIAVISPLPSTTYPANALQSFPVKATSQWLKFSFSKVVGNLAFDDFFLTKRQAVVADFSTTSTSACVGDSICFSDLSTAACGNVVSWSWDFGDGSSSNAQNPCNAFSTAGTYTVKLIVINNSSEIDSSVKTISVGEFPVASFLLSDSTGCSPLTILFSDASTISSGAISNYQWDFGNGNISSLQNPIESFDTGSFQVSLVVSSDLGCTDTTYGNVTSFSLPLIDTSAVTVTSPTCGANDGSVTGITATGNSPFSYFWSDGSSTLDLTNVPDGNYSLAISDTNNCSSSVNFILVSPGSAPSPTLSSTNINYCEGANIDTLYATGTGGTINWYSDSALTSLITTGTSYLPILVPGVNYFYVTETGTSCQSPATVVVVNVNPNPIADAGPDITVCDGNCVQLSASGSDFYQWAPAAFLDDSTIANPLSCGLVTTTYSVIATNSFGCSSTDSVTVYINPQDTLIYENFNSYTGTVGTTPAGWTLSIDTTNAFYSTIASSGQSGPNSLKFSATGHYIISPTFFKADSVRFWIKGSSASTANFFYVLETSDSINWDTIASISPLPTSNYPVNAIQSFPVKSTSIRLKFYYIKTTGNVAFDDFFLTKRQSIVSDFSTSTGAVCVGSSVCFNDLSTAACGSVVGWNWDFGDGNVSTSQNPCNTFTSAGTYNVKLTVTKNTSEIDSTVKTITVSPIANATINPAGPFCESDPTVFLTAVDNGGVWSGNGITNTATGAFNPAVTGGGTFNITHVINGACGDVDTILIIVNPNPVANFGFEIFGDSVSYHDSSSSVVTWAWDFCDGSAIDITPNPSHIFLQDGIFCTCLTVTNSSGCTDTHCDTIIIIGIQEQLNISPFDIFPNPSGGKFTIVVSGDRHPVSSIKVSNFLGEEIINTQYSILNAQYSIDLSNEPVGTYFVTITSGNDIATKKIVIVR